MRRTLLRGVAFAGALTGVLAAPPAYAWKPKTHIYLAEEALRDALDNGKVTLRLTDYRTGKVVGDLGEFEVDPQVLAAIRAAPQQYRAGVLGPDAYPDILTGQQIIHPEAAEAVGAGANGSNAWLSYLWRRGFIEGSSPQVRAFTVGYLTHAAGDVFAHTFVNHFAGGEFMLTPDPTNAMKHLVLEGYIGKRTPATISAISSSVATGGPANARKRDDLDIEDDVQRGRATYHGTVTQEQTSISGVESFIYRELTYAAPGSVLERKLMKGAGTSRSIPYVFSTLRNGLQKQVGEYDRVRMSKSGPAGLAYAAANGPAAEYKRAWIKDIDEGLAAFPAVSHEIAKAIVYNEGGSDMKRAKAVMDQYVVDHLASMAGAPDAAVATVAFISSVIDGILPPPMREALRALTQAPLDLLVKGVSGRTADEWADYLKNPENHFDEIMSRRGGGHGGESDHPIDLAAFNREHLKLPDAGYSNPSLKWRVDDLPPAFNTIQLTKLMLLGDKGLSDLDAALKAKGSTIGGPPGEFRNLMLGWVRSLDAGNQWQGLGGSPQPAFAANGGSAYRRLFLQQVGEKPWIADAPQDEAAEASPPPAAPTQDLAPFAGDWDTTLGRVKLVLEEGGVLRGRLMTRDSYGAEREGERLELRDGGTAGQLTGQALYAAHASQLTLTFDAERNTFKGSSKAASSSSPHAWSGKRLTAPGKEEKAPEPATAQPAPAQPAPSPAPGGGEPTAQAGVFHPLEDFDVQFERAVAARNGTVHVFLAVKNTTARARSIGAGVFKAVAYDADGVGTSESQILRTGAETPESFPATPVIPPGGGLRFRFVMTPPSATPLSVVSIRESDRRSLVFSLGGVQPAAGTATSPAPGGSGPFKELSKLDVRIDRVAKARDGLIEVFVTLRNPGPTVQTTSKGWIKFTATDADGTQATTRSALYPVRGPRAAELPLLIAIAPGGEARLRYVFEVPVSGPITASDGSIKQVFAPSR